MSLSHKVDIYEGSIQDADRKDHKYRVALALICIAVGLAVVSAIFTPVAIGSGISSEISLVGP